MPLFRGNGTIVKSRESVAQRTRQAKRQLGRDIVIEEGRRKPPSARDLFEKEIARVDSSEDDDEEESDDNLSDFIVHDEPES